jgi:hypothetical protein
VSTSQRQPGDTEPQPEAANPNPEPPQSSLTAAQSWDGAPFLTEATNAESAPLPVSTPGTAKKVASEDAQDGRNSRLSSLRNLLFVLGVNHGESDEELAELHAGAGSNSDFRTERPTFDRTIQQAPIDAAANMRGASPRLVTAPPEFLPPKPVVIEFDSNDARVAESSSRQDRRAAADGLEILPSKRGQYKKI